MAYFKRYIDDSLLKWKDSTRRKPLLLRGARQVGKSSSIKNLGKSFKHFIHVNFEANPDIKNLFKGNLNVRQICGEIGIAYATPVIPGETLLFLDEIQACPEALKSLWFLKEDYPELHVAAAGSLLEFTLKEIPSFGIGRIHSEYMYPFSFGEFLMACGKSMWLDAIRKADSENPLSDAVHSEIVKLFRIFILVGGMPASVSAWVETGDFTQCRQEQTDIIKAYYDDFAKYNSKIDTRLLRNTLQSVVMQTGCKFVYSRVDGDFKSGDVKTALDLLKDAGLITRINYTSANGLPLGAQSNIKFFKYLYIDTGLMLCMQSLDFRGTPNLDAQMLTMSAADLVNRGGVAEMAVGLELIKCDFPGYRPELFYWENISRGTSSEVDYVIAYNMTVLPIEVKAGTSGKMKSLKLFMESKKLNYAIRTSLENFGRIDFAAAGSESMIDILPIYAIGRLARPQNADAPAKPISWTF